MSLLEQMIADAKAGTLKIKFVHISTNKMGNIRKFELYYVPVDSRHARNVTKILADYVGYKLDKNDYLILRGCGLDVRLAFCNILKNSGAEFQDIDPDEVYY